MHMRNKVFYADIMEAVRICRSCYNFRDFWIIRNMSNISILSIKDEAYICYIVVYITEQCVSIYAGKIVGMDYN